MSEILDNYCNGMTNKAESFKKIAECIKEYINQKVNKIAIKNKLDLNKIIKATVPDVRVDALTAKNAAVLCGCLLFAESCDVRNPTRGKWEKKAIEKVISEINKGNTNNPFQTVFSNKPNLNPNSNPNPNRPLYSPAARGGMDKSSWVITGKVDITKDFPDTKLLHVFQRLNSNHISKDKNYITFLKDPKLHENEFSEFIEFSKRLRNISLSDTFTINTFSEMISNPTKITTKQLQDALFHGHKAYSKELENKINFYREKWHEDNTLKIIHLIWSSDKLSKNNKIRVSDLIQLLNQAPVGGTREAIVLIDKFNPLPEYRKRLANLYEP